MEYKFVCIKKGQGAPFVVTRIIKPIFSDGYEIRKEGYCDYYPAKRQLKRFISSQGYKIFPYKLDMEKYLNDLNQSLGQFADTPTDPF